MRELKCIPGDTPVQFGAAEQRSAVKQTVQFVSLRRWLGILELTPGEVGRGVTRSTTRGGWSWGPWKERHEK